jgi:signal transduction histidine kinase
MRWFGFLRQAVPGMVDFHALFEQNPCAQLVLQPDRPRYSIAAVSDEYLHATHTRRDGPEGIIGRGIFEVFPDRPDDPEATGTRNLQHSLDAVLSTNAPHIMAVQRYDIQDPAGGWEVRYWEPLNTPVRGADGGIAYILHYVRDVTDREQQREATAIADTAREQAEEANHAKMDFLAAMSHELRTPLNAISGYVDLLELGIHGPITDAQRAALLRVSANQRHLLRLINDILSYAKLESGKLILDKEKLSARQILESMDPLIAPQAHGKGIAYSVQVCDPSLEIVADAERVRQILLNLVGNAVKFTPEGGWVVLACDPDGNRVRFRVQDNGPGIPLEQQEAIFNPFVQLGRKYDTPQEGVGLGLAISKDLAQAMGGDISVESDPGHGSTFWVVLPRAGDQGGASDRGS